MSSPIQTVLGILKTWAGTVVTEAGAQGIYLFGSLIYKNGDQFGVSSDIDLVVLMPDLNSVTARHRWAQQLQELHDALEVSLIRPLRRQANEPSVSIVLATNLEIEADIHKEGHREFFSKNRFLDLISGSTINGIPGAGTKSVDRYLNNALSVVQRVRNEYLSESANGTTKLESFIGSDPIPKRLMRAASMAEKSRKPQLGAGAEYDVQEGLDAISDYLYVNRDDSAQLFALQNIVSVRRGARGQGGPIEPLNQLLLAEVIYEIAVPPNGNGDPQRSIDSKNSSGSSKSYDISAGLIESLTPDPNASVKDDTDAKLFVERPQRKGHRQSSLSGQSSTAFFHDRFTNAFPGIRDIFWIDSFADLKARLSVLFREPIAFSDGTPIWWWRGGNLHIDKFKLLENDTFLMNYQELAIRSIAAVPGHSYKQDFLYVEAGPMRPTGLYDVDEKSRERHMSTFGYDSEEYGIFAGKTLLTREEYDDGAAWRDGVHLTTSLDSELRVRYTTPYNFLVAANGSPINNPHFDRTLETMLNQALQGDRVGVLKVLSEKIFGLPLRTQGAL